MPAYLNIAFAFYFLAALFFTLELFFRHKLLAPVSRLFIFLSFAGLSLYIFTRWQSAARPPLSNMFESLVVFAWAVAAAVLYIDLRQGIKNVCAFSSWLGLLTLGYASFLNKEIAPLLPALKSNWLTIHVLSCFIGYAALTVGFAASVIILLKKTAGLKLDALAHSWIAFGFLFLTLGIITGSIWANSAWGTYWSWDPKETWSLITWIIYALYLHSRFTRGWKARKAAWVALIGFLAMLFTYFGVNYLLSGLHSYV